MISITKNTIERLIKRMQNIKLERQISSGSPLLVGGVLVMPIGLLTKYSDSEVKKAFRKMASKFHPDKVHHLGDEFQKMAEEKFKSVNDAYQQIKKERNLN